MNELEMFAKALEQAPGQRDAWLDEVCADNPQQRQRLDHLLNMHAHTGAFLETPAAEILGTANSRMIEQPGTRVGRYTLVEEIASGGMGVVYLAEQTEPVQRRVALKIIKPGMDSERVIGRFETERKVLAMMDHPNIAKVLDAGTTDSGYPYFVMELVNGLPITRYCDEQQLTPRERLEVLVPVCQAVQHAHQKGIIHRDLKPSNVLVAVYDGQPVPKVIDFGVAKAIGEAMTDDPELTRHDQIVGTLDYMSPEQAGSNELDIDTRSDVYSLGAVLYELLTGETPHNSSRMKSAAFDEMLRIIREDEPPRPSTKLSSSESLPVVAACRNLEPARLSTVVRGELDWIVMKTLEKDRSRRYASAHELTYDIQHYLRDEPVRACPPSKVYLFQKFARRHRAALSTGIALALVLLMGAAGTSWQAINATAERDKASGERDRANAERDRANGERNRANQERDRANDERDRATRLYAADQTSMAVQRLSGWREQAQAQIIAAADIRPDDDTASAFTRTLSGFDAEVLWQESTATGRVAFDRDNAHLVAALPGGGARLVDLAGNTAQQLEGRPTPGGHGPIGFDVAGQPVQVACVTPDRFDWTPLGTQQPVVSLELPENSPADEIRQRWSQTTPSEQIEIRNRLDELARATPDMDRLLCWHGIPGEDGSSSAIPGVVALWDARRGDILQTVPARESALAIAPDGSIFALARLDGRVEVRSSTSGDILTTLPTGLPRISAMAIAHDPRRIADGGDDELAPWLLAVADKRGTIGVWDLNNSAPINMFRGVIHEVHAITFRPDSLVLGIAGSRSAQLWDTFGAGHLLTLSHTAEREHLVWSANGSLLAVNGVGTGEWQEAQLWQLESDQGVRALRGLAAAGAKVVFSTDGEWLAAMANDWSIGIWEHVTGRMIRLLQPPPGFHIDNCALQFSRDGHSLYFSAGSRMTKWDVASGERLDEWMLPRGLQDCIGITEDGRVLLMRYDLPDAPRETGDPQLGVCRLREVRRRGETLEIAAWNDFDFRIYSIVGSRDGRYFALDGKPIAGERLTLVIDGQSGDRVALVDGTHENPSIQLAIADEAGFFLQYAGRSGINDAETMSKLFDLSDGSETGQLSFLCTALSPDGRYGLHPGSELQWCDLYHIPAQHRLIRLPLTSFPSHYQADFSSDGGLVAWAQVDGLVMVCDLERLRTELARVSTEW